MPTAAVLDVSQDVPRGSISLQSDSAYAAVRSRRSDAIPFIPWKILKVRPAKNSKVVVNPKEFGPRNLRPGTEILWDSVEPIKLTRVVLAVPASEFAKARSMKDSIRSMLPSLTMAGCEVPQLKGIVKACEPVDQGLIDEHTPIAVVESDEMVQTGDFDISVEGFLDLGENKTFANLEVRTLRTPFAKSSILPVPSQLVDPENMVYTKLDQLAALGVFSGDTVEVKNGERARLVQLYSHPVPAEADDGIYMSPFLVHNLGNPATVDIRRSTEFNGYETAKDVVLSRVSSPASTDRSNQNAYLRGLKAHFAGGVARVVANGDIVPIPINQNLSKMLAGLQAQGDQDEDFASLLLDETTTYDAVVWFKVNGLASDQQYVINPAQTRMVQSGFVQELAPSTLLHWQQYLGIPVDFDFTQHGKLFSYAHYLKQLLEASIGPRGAALKSTILAKSSKRGAGKTTLLTSVAAELGIHVMVLNAFELIGESDGKTLGALKARIERAATTSQCLLTIVHLEALAKKNDIDGKDTNLVNGLVDVLDDAIRSGGITLAATVSDPDQLADSIRNKFKFEVDVTVPTEPERAVVLQYLTSSAGGMNDSNQIASKLDAGLLTGFALRDDVSVSSMALQSAGLTPPDLQAIILCAKQLALSQSTKSTILSQRGIVKIAPSHIEEAISDARGKFSDSIGAPKIPNVGLKDVGGLDIVKGEILDTIDMPLKHPELFANGLKKRSGILFYGPPGTGKTLLAKAIATNFSLNFFSVKGPEMLNMYIGESEANVRRVFQKARDAKPCVIFFDELDSVAPKRGNKGDSGGVMDRIVSQLLAELDGMSEGSDGVFVVGATNRPDLLDEALLRPGRFDKMLYLGVSDTHEKQRAILQALTRKFDLAPDVDLMSVAQKCPFNFTGADFYAMSSDAMLNAMTRTAGEVDAKISKYNEEHPDSPITIRKWFQKEATDDDVRVVVTEQDFEKAQKELVPSISADELAHYLRVRDTFEGQVTK